MSTQWNKIVFQKDASYPANCHKMKENFRKLRVSSGSPIDMALFSRSTSSRTDTFYFSPACTLYVKSFLAEHSAKQCDPPNPVGLGLEIGDQSSLSTIYGESVTK